ncbi:MAG: ABC transporter ATP-binding protein [Acidimicrobiia bacterium]
MSPLLECRDVSVRYSNVVAVSGLDLTVDRGETVALLGPSGSGKSTIMYAIAGFVPVADGRISIAGVNVSSPKRTRPPETRPVGLVFQNYALWPHMTALENVAYPFRRAGHSGEQSTHRAAELLAKVGIGDLGDRKPGELSGGQQQRVGLARALARSAEIYLFDEPTAHLDSPVRDAVEKEIRRRREELGSAAIYATHDSEEALAIADRVVILRDGRPIQVGTPAEIYERPTDEWSARLTGPVSEISGRAAFEGQGRVQVLLGDSSFEVESASPVTKRTVGVLVRPEWVTPGGPINGRVVSVAFRGPHTDYTIATPHGEVVARVAGSPKLSEGEQSAWTIQRGWVPPGSEAE